MPSRKKFIESKGATCKNWNWSWSFVNHAEKFVIFGLWDVHDDGLILDEKWSGPSKSQSMEHVRLVSEEGYQLKIFPMEFTTTDEGRAKIKGFEPVLIDKQLIKGSGKWYAVGGELSEKSTIAEEVHTPDIYTEGATTTISVNAYERNAKARSACIKHYGCKCFICDFNFESFYGKLGSKYIHVHHEVALSELKKEYIVDPINDLKPLCPNCHAMIHRTHPPMSVKELSDILSDLHKSGCT
ncbi:MAG: HNH endonuclease [Halomonas sp.]|nr:HNH endonuclease [Halomonas sp.]MDP3536130.1 HNH endonuclease [Halomonas sp.]